MTRTLNQRCFNHVREAVARCPGCVRFFCRECVTEHEHRWLCAVCLGKIAAAPASAHRASTTAVRVFQISLGFLVAWFFFFALGQILLLIPESYHDASVWNAPWYRSK